MPALAPTPTNPITLPELLMLSRQAEHYARDLQRLRQECGDARRALREARVDALLRLAAAVEQKDDDTGRHVVRIGHYSALIARAMGQPADWCDRLLYASRMHDLGKIGIPDSILKKPGPLTDAEWAVMRRHPEIGSTVHGGSDNELFRMAAEVSLGHHEKFDGSGYPYGLARDRIPLEARIVAIADVYDALTSKRHYKEAWTVAETIAYMRSQSGMHFDPLLLDRFLACFEELEQVRLTFADPMSVID